MHTPSTTLPELLSGLRVALEADARDVPNADSDPNEAWGRIEALILALLAQLIARLESLSLAWHHTPLGAQAPAKHNRWPDRMPFHWRLRDARRAVMEARAGRGRLRIATWWSWNPGARALIGRLRLIPRPIAARAPPVSAPRVPSGRHHARPPAGGQATQPASLHPSTPR